MVLVGLVCLFITAVVVYVQGGFLPESLSESFLCLYILVMLVWSIVRVIEGRSMGKLGLSIAIKGIR